MLLLLVIGMMNLFVVVLLTVFVVLEKNFASGPWFTRLSAVVAVLLAVAALFIPQLSAGLKPMQM